MTAPRTATDLDQDRALLAAPADVLARLFEMTEALAKHRRIDPQLRRDIVRVAEKVAPALVEQLERELDEATPAAVLEAHEHELIEDRPALGAFPRRDTLAAPLLAEWLTEDPTRLRGVVYEVGRFCKDDRRVVETVLALAEQLGIDGHLAANIIGCALRDTRHPHQAAAQ
jgi:hypothetical protein